MGQGQAPVQSRPGLSCVLEPSRWRVPARHSTSLWCRIEIAKHTVLECRGCGRTPEQSADVLGQHCVEFTCSDCFSGSRAVQNLDQGGDSGSVVPPTAEPHQIGRAALDTPANKGFVAAFERKAEGWRLRTARRATPTRAGS